MSLEFPELVLFSTEETLLTRAEAAGIPSLIVDLERRGKDERQKERDTEINADTLEDLARLRPQTSLTCYCRLDPFGPWTEGQVDSAIRLGANRLLLPMVETAGQVERYLKVVGGRAGAGILVETEAGCRGAQDLAAFPLDRVYVGLNDLAISRNDPHIFCAVADGTVDRLRQIFTSTTFGFAGLTVLGGGHPIPCAHLLGEMARLRCGFAFLRRSFRRDAVGADLSKELDKLKTRWATLVLRTPAEVGRDRELLLRILRDLPGYGSRG